MIEGRKQLKLMSDTVGENIINKLKNSKIHCKYWWRGKDFNFRPSGYEFYVHQYYWILLRYTTN